MHKKITLHLWYDHEAKEAVNLYTCIFNDSHINHTHTLTNTPSGTVETISFQLLNTPLEAISAGPYFTFTNAISLLVKCDTDAQVDTYVAKFIAKQVKYIQTNKLTIQLTLPMQYDNYTIVKDIFGVTWVFVDKRTLAYRAGPTISPIIFHKTDAGKIMLYYKDFFQAKQVSNCLKIEDSTIYFENYHLAEKFTPAISLMYACEDQKEIDSFYNGFSNDTKSEECGWLSDKYDISWQVVPSKLFTLAKEMNDIEYQSLNEKILQMKKIDMTKL